MAENWHADSNGDTNRDTNRDGDTNWNTDAGKAVCAKADATNTA